MAIYHFERTTCVGRSSVSFICCLAVLVSRGTSTPCFFGFALITYYVQTWSIRKPFSRELGSFRRYACEKGWLLCVVQSEKTIQCCQLGKRNRRNTWKKMSLHYLAGIHACFFVFVLLRHEPWNRVKSEPFVTQIGIILPLKSWVIFGKISKYHNFYCRQLSEIILHIYGSLYFG